MIDIAGFQRLTFGILEDFQHCHGNATRKMLQPENIKNTLHAYQMAKRCNVKRVMAEAVKWGERCVRKEHSSPEPIFSSTEEQQPRIFTDLYSLRYRAY